ncbi:MAG: HEPN domain-containing protein [Desulfovibrio sp.]|jgi:HEPN domain-containing protein|nr:HEPN domain-containing protein [Desulfovibrio sp.]
MVKLLPMTNEEKYSFWLDHAQYDLATAEAMFTSGRWFYVVFMSQQAIEKLVKGLYTLYVDDDVPRVHNIKAIIERFEDKLTRPVPVEHYLFFNMLSAHYLNNRYPDFINKLSGQIKKDEAHKILQQTKETFAWLLTLKP